jgi:urease accessory protein
MHSGLLLLADSRLPSGGHGHSGGVEALVDRGLLRSAADLAEFLAGRIATGAAVPAGAAAAACVLGSAAIGGAAAWTGWDQAVSARLPATATRMASYAQGAALLRTATCAWPVAALAALRELPRVHHPLVLGAAAAAAGGSPSDAALLAVHHLVGGACTAAVRLLGLDPLAVAAVAAEAGRKAEPMVAAAARAGVAAAATRDPALLPADGNPLYDVLAQLHRSTEATLFAS